MSRSRGERTISEIGPNIRYQPKSPESSVLRPDSKRDCSTGQSNIRIHDRRVFLSGVVRLKFPPPPRITCFYLVSANMSRGGDSSSPSVHPTASSVLCVSRACIHISSEKGQEDPVGESRKMRIADDTSTLRIFARLLDNTTYISLNTSHKTEVIDNTAIQIAKMFLITGIV